MSTFPNMVYNPPFLSIEESIEIFVNGDIYVDREYIERSIVDINLNQTL